MLSNDLVSSQFYENHVYKSIEVPNWYFSKFLSIITTCKVIHLISESHHDMQGWHSETYKTTKRASWSTKLLATSQLARLIPPRLPRSRFASFEYANLGMTIHFPESGDDNPFPRVQHHLSSAPVTSRHARLVQCEFQNRNQQYWPWLTLFELTNIKNSDDIAAQSLTICTDMCSTRVVLYVVFKQKKSQNHIAKNRLIQSPPHAVP